MKNIKTYKLFESKNRIWDKLHYEKDLLNLEDILLELNDAGYRTEVDLTPISSIRMLNLRKDYYKSREEHFNQPNSYPKLEFFISIHSPQSNLYGDSDQYKEEVDECIERCLHYLEINNYSTFISCPTSPTSYQIMFRCN